MEVEIEPTSFDAIVLGTGLPESILAGAIAKSGLKVLHVDNSDFFGSHWSTLSLETFKAWANSGGVMPPQTLDVHLQTPRPACASDGAISAPDGAQMVDEEEIESSSSNSRESDASSDPSIAEALNRAGVYAYPLLQPSIHTSLYSDVKVYEFAHSTALGESRRYNLDICGPRLLMCAEDLIDTLISSGAHNYAEYKAVEGTYLCIDGVLLAVPASRADIFQQSMPLPQKHNLWKFLKQVAQYAEKEASGISETFRATNTVEANNHGFALSDLTEETLHAPFIQYLQKRKLPDSVQKYILYCIALADDEQFSEKSNFISVEEGLKRMSIYLHSIGRFGVTTQHNPFLFPIYGFGEICQAFCRVSAVHGSVYVLRHHINSVLLDKVTNACKGILTKFGQLLFAPKVILSPSFLPEKKFSPIFVASNATEVEVPSSEASGSEPSQNPRVPQTFTSLPEFCHVARFLCISDKSLIHEKSNLLIFFPPKSFDGENENVVKVFQVGSSSKVCPQNRYVVMMSTKVSVADSNVSAESVLGPFVNSLFNVYVENNEDQSNSSCSEGDQKDNTADNIETELSHGSQRGTEMHDEKVVDSICKNSVEKKCNDDDNGNSNGDASSGDDDNDSEARGKKPELQLQKDEELKLLEREIDRNLGLNNSHHDPNSNLNSNPSHVNGAQNLAAEDVEDSKPRILWCVYYNQKLLDQTKLFDDVPEGTGFCNMPDESINCMRSMSCAKQVFNKLFPDLEFYPPDPDESLENENEAEAELFTEAVPEVTQTHSQNAVFAYEVNPGVAPLPPEAASE